MDKIIDWDIKLTPYVERLHQMTCKMFHVGLLCQLDCRCYLPSSNADRYSYTTNVIHVAGTTLCGVCHVYM